MNIKDLQQKLPNNWNEVTLEVFQKLTTCKVTENQDIFDGIQNSLSVMSIILDIPEEQLEELSMIDLNKLGERLNFMSEPIEPAAKPSIKVKPLDEITYNDYVGFIQVKEEHLQQLHKFIKQFGITDKTEEEILQLPIPDALGFFFIMQSRITEISEAFSKVNQNQNPSTSDERKGESISKENEKVRSEIHRTFGWHFLAIELATMTNDTFHNIMNTPATEVAGLALIAHYKTLYNTHG